MGLFTWLGYAMPAVTSFSFELMTHGKHELRAGVCDDSDQRCPGHTLSTVYTPAATDQGQAGMTPPHEARVSLSPRATCPEITLYVTL